MAGRGGRGGRHRVHAARRAGLASILAAVLLLVPQAAGAQEEAPRVGYVDVQLIRSQYLAPNLEGAMAELDRTRTALQDEFDQKSASLDDQEKQALFDEYQKRLDASAQELRRLQAEFEARVLEAIAAVAGEQGVEIVLQKEVVLHGGVDLTASVLRRLGVQTNPSGGS
ncbi:OmpH family outer membrane protein [Limnochorda pilosa]|uniref:Molecular chaperone Skp n=1 Tax=Limnochorda pilosa TaxID=1555112 RepID=A0A0K2SP53_LIMPI|nr:OmpH family outer membrane protein [Limnochorda pilosa]BAS28900.1 hypothetical protein LIP_3071 [Limnochorda pilosa]